MNGKNQQFFFFKENPFGNQGEKKGFSWQPNTLNLERKESTKGMNRKQVLGF